MTELVTRDYGWAAGHSYTASYLAQPILKVCNRLQPRRILDVGCGNGCLTKHLVDAGYAVVGCDADTRGIELAREQAPGARFQLCSVYDDPSVLGEGDFDLVLASEVIEHLFFPRRLISFVEAVLAPSGYFVVTTPYHGYMKNLALSLLDRWDFHHGVLDDGGHIKFWSPKTLKLLLDEFDFEVVEFQGVGRVRWLWKSMLVVSQRR